MTKILIFDLETQKLANEVGGWSNISKMGLSASVIYDVQADRISRFTENQSSRLIEELDQASMVIGFNVLRFDYAVLVPYGLQISPALRGKTTDILQDLYQNLGFRVSLDNLAVATLGEKKSADGLAAVQWYREGLIDKVLDYCEIDVRVTYRLWAHGVAHGHVLFTDKRGDKRKVEVRWSSPVAHPPI